MESSEGGDLHKTATPPSAAKKSPVAGGKTEPVPPATPPTDDGYTTDEYAEDAQAWLERMTEAEDARATAGGDA